MAKSGKFVALIVIAALAVTAFALAGCTQPAATTPAESTSTAAPAVDLKLVTPGQLTAGSDTTFPPFESMNGSVAEGFDVDLLTAIAKEMGINKVVFSSEIFDSLIPTVKAGGKFDAVMSAMTITDERKKEISFSDPYIDSNQSVAVKNDSAIKSLDDLKK